MIINVIFNIIFIPKYGLYGAAFSSLSAYLFYFIAVLHVTQNLKLIFFTKFKYLLFAMPIWTAGFYLWDDIYGFWWMWIACIVSASIYWLVLYIFNKEEMIQFYKKVKQING